ncbi:MAG: cytochrome c biogenesis protein ResB [Tannerella sp.]|jgi:hypothetical protein|nr:cytochrome c biogenesis protein ResB [Tannerella sp.]
MWKQPWGYIEGWTICGGIFITGMILQFSTGKIVPESFHFPFNLISGAVFMVFLLLFYLTSKKIKVLQWFSGYTAAITSLASLLLLVVIMGLTRQSPSSSDLSYTGGWMRTGFMQMTVSWSFILLFLYFVWVLGLVVLKRVSCFKWKDTGFILNHLGLFIALFAALLGSSDLQRVRMTTTQNSAEWRATNDRDEMVELPLAIELKSFTIDEYPPKLMLLDNKSGEALPAKQPKNVSVETCPMNAGLLDWKLEITKYLPLAATVFNRDTVNYVEYQSEGATSAVYVKARNTIDNTQKEGWVSCGNYLFPYNSLRLNDQVSLIMPTREPKHFESNVTVYAQSGETKSATVEVNKPLTVAGWKIYQTSYDEVMGKWSQKSVFELVKDPWLPVVYTGLCMMLAGAVFLFISANPVKSN